MTASDAHVVREGTLPTPFSADELRAGLPAGTRIVLINHDGSTTEHVFSECDASGCLYEVTEAQAGERPRVRAERTTWLELQSHAAFEAASTTRIQQRIDHPLGTLACWRYDVTGADAVRTFWFDRGRPGMPIRMEVRQEGVIAGGFEATQWHVAGAPTG